MMARSTRFILIAVAAVIVLILLVTVSVPLFVNGNDFRARIETTLSKSLGRKVTIGNLKLSVWSGGLVAKNATIADDPRFSTAPFVQADSVKIDVEMLPLLFHREVRVRGFVLESPKVQLLRAADGTWNYSTIRSAANRPAAENAQTKQIFPDVTVGHVNIKDGRITVGSAPMNGAASAPNRVYQQVNLEVKNFGFANSFPFTASAHLPEGTIDIRGKAGPINQNGSAATPIDAKVLLKHVELGTAGILPPDAGIAGIVDLQVQVRSDGQSLKANGTGSVAGIKLAKDGQPSAKPVQIQFALSQNEQAMTGQIQHATITVGRAAIHVAGTFQSSGPTTAINLKVNGNAVPIDEIEAFLPAIGVHLPQGSRLQGGTATTTLTVSGSTADPIITGPVRLENTQLAGFNLGSKLQGLSQLTGGRIGGATGSGTTIRSLSMNVHQAAGVLRTDNIALDVAGVGTATGAGTVSQGGALNYNMLLKLTGLMSGPANNHAASGSGGVAGVAGGLTGLIPGGAGSSMGSIGGVAGGVAKSGIPVAIGGTTSNPTFTPNVRGLATGMGASAAQNLLNGKSNKSPAKSNPGGQLTNTLGGLLGKH